MYMHAHSQYLFRLSLDSRYTYISHISTDYYTHIHTRSRVHMIISPESQKSLYTSIVTSVDDGLLRISTGCTIAGFLFLVTQYAASLNFTVATI